MRSADVVVIGAGVIGSSIAYHLAARGVRNIRVVDRAADQLSGSTPRATGGFRSQFGTAVNVRLSMLSRQKLLRFQDEIGVDSGYRPYGYLFMARSQREMDELTAAQRVQHSCGVTEARTIDAEEIRRLNPAVHDPSLIGGTFCPTDGFIVATQILAGYTEAAKRLGVRFEFNTELSPLSLRERVAEGRVREPLIRRFAAPSPAGRRVMDFDRGVTYVNAAGAWAADVSDVPVTPLRRRAACTIPTTVLPANMPMTIWVGDAFHVRVRNGRVMLVWPDTPPDDDVWLDKVIAWANERMPVLRDVPIDPAHCWEGLYEMSPDRHAIIGRDPERENLFLANGSSGHGVMHAPAIGQLLAEMIVDGKTSIDISALRPSRFAEGKPIRGPELL